MNTNFTIKNPKANSVIGMYVDEPIGMDHPLFMVRFQSRIDAGSLYQNGTPIQDAIQSTVKRMRGLFGGDIPEELVRTTVSLVYAENDALQPKPSGVKLPIPSKPIDIEGRTNANNVKKIKNEVHKEKYPRMFFDGPAVCSVSILDNATKEELVAKAVGIVMSSGRRACVVWSESETISAEPASWRANLGMKYPHIAVSGNRECVLFYPDAMTKDELIEKAAEIVATWCPKACVVWSSTETICPGSPQL